MTNWPWPLDGVQGWFENLYKSVYRWVWSVGQWIYNNLNSLIRTAWSITWSAANWIAGRIWGWIQWLYSVLSPVIWRAIEGAKAFFNSILAGAKTAILNTINFLERNLRWFINASTGTILSFVGFLGKNLQGILDTMWHGISDLFNTTWKLTNWMFESLGKTFNTLINAVMEKVGGVGDMLRGRFDDLFGNVGEALLGLPLQFINTVREQQDTVNKIFTGIFDAVARHVKDQVSKPVSDIFKQLPSPPTIGSPAVTIPDAEKVGEQYLSKLHEIAETVNTQYLHATLGIVGIECASLGQVDFSLQNIMYAPAWFAVQNMAREVYNAEPKYILNNVIPLYFNAKYTPKLPDPDVLIEMYAWGRIKSDDFYSAMKALGYSSTAADYMFDAALTYGSLEDLFKMYWRGLIGEGLLKSILRKYKYSPDVIDQLIIAKQKIPGASDLITFVVREVISPEDFKKYMAWQGYEEKWADYYWEAHWKLPALETIAEQWHRGFLSEDELRKYLVWHDYKPKPRPGISVSDVDIMVQHLYSYPGRIDSRWAWEWGQLTDKEYEELVKAEGIHPKYAKKIAEARKLNVLRDEINRIRSALIDMYADGWINKAELKKRLQQLGYINKIVELNLQYADIKREKEFKNLLKKLYEEAFEKKQIDKADFKNALIQLGMDRDFAEKYVRYVELKLMPKPKLPRQQLAGT